MPAQESDSTRRGNDARCKKGETVSCALRDWKSLWLELWSGLSESNRHLNLGKVPYYHYTKAANSLNSYNTRKQPRQAPCSLFRPSIEFLSALRLVACAKQPRNLTIPTRCAQTLLPVNAFAVPRNALPFLCPYIPGQTSRRQRNKP